LAGIIQGRTAGNSLTDSNQCNFFNVGQEMGKARSAIIRYRKVRAFKRHLWNKQLKIQEPQKREGENSDQLRTSYRHALNALIDNKINEYDENKQNNTISGGQIREALANLNDSTQTKEFNISAQNPQVYERYVHIPEHRS